MDTLTPAPEERWRQPRGLLRGLALTADAAVTLEDTGGQTWSVVVRSRTDGATLAKTALPATPVHDGLAVSADGRVIVALCDGQVLCLGR